MVAVKFDPSIVKEWIGTSGGFVAACKGPGIGKPSEDPAVLTKFLVSGMYCMLLSHICFFVSGALNQQMAVGGLVQACISAFLSTWISWFCFVKREPSCCFVCVCIEDFKFMHLIWGILLIVGGVSQVYNYILGPFGLLKLLEFITAPYAIVFAIGVVFIVLYSVCNIGAGVCLVKIGSKKAGVDLPDAAKGAPEEQTIGAPELATNA